MRLLISVILILLYQISTAQYTGAKEHGMGGVVSANISVFTAAYSPAASSFAQHPQFGADIKNHGLFKDIYTATLAAIQPSGVGSFSYTLNSYGASHYQEINTGFGYAKLIQNQWSVGIRFNYHHLRISGYGHRHLVSLDLGSMYQFNQKIQLGITIRNPIRHKLEKSFKSSKSSSIIVGGAYKPNQKIMVAWDLEKSLAQSVAIHWGINYQIHDYIELQTGISLKPYAVHAGIGINKGSVALGLSTNWTNTLSFSPQLSLCYNFYKGQNDD